MTALVGKVALVTGAAKGIGKATALALAEAGASVLVSDRNRDQGEAVVAEIRANGGTASFRLCDCTDEAQVDALTQAALAEWGRLDCAVNNAGTTPAPSSLVSTPTEDWRRVIATNLDGIFYALKSQIPAIKRSGGGSIVNMASTTGLRGAAGLSAYSASKHGVIGLTRSAALEAAADNIRINAICPGAIETPLFQARMGTPAIRDRIVAQTPLGRVGRAEEVASLALWLCSDSASYVTGTEFIIDGGRSTR